MAALISQNQRLITPIDTALYPPSESEINIAQWKEKLGKYKRIRVRKAKFLKTEVNKFYL